MAVTRTSPIGRTVSSETIDTFVPEPRTRAFIIGSTGSGKSTLAEVLLDRYHSLYPLSRLYIIDPKKRFIAVERTPEENDRNHSQIDQDSQKPIPLFPYGYSEKNWGRRDQVAILADYLDKAGDESDEDVYLIQNEQVGYDLFDWLYEHANVQRPSLVYADESFDFIRGVRSHPSVRRLFQQGREMGIGFWIINQRPRWIDQTWLSEANYLFIGLLNHRDDRDHIARAVSDPVWSARLKRMLPERYWLYVDSRKRHSELFTVKL